MASAADDPGWGPAVKAIPRFLIPYTWRADGAGLTKQRAALLYFLLSLTAYGVVLSFLFSDSRAKPQWPAEPSNVGVFALGVASAIAIAVFRGRTPLSRLTIDVLVDDAAVRNAYRKRFFLAVAFANCAALIGFVAAFYTRSTWTYIIGAGWAAAELIAIAPTRNSLRIDQARLRDLGSTTDLMFVLTA